MKILVLADIHGEFYKSAKVIDKIKTEGIDLIICPGDFTDMFNIPDGFSQMDIADMVLQKILALNIPALCVPGNHDPYEVLELFNEYGVNLHDNVRKVKGINFIGWGGAETPFNTIFEPSEKETEEELEVLYEKAGKPFILIVHDPPKDTILDKISTGKHVGSAAIRKFIEERQPLLSISAHIHEATGTEKINNTTIFYPGALYDGYYGIVEIKGNKIKCSIEKTDI